MTFREVEAHEFWRLLHTVVQSNWSNTRWTPFSWLPALRTLPGGSHIIATDDTRISHLFSSLPAFLGLLPKLWGSNKPVLEAEQGCRKHKPQTNLVFTQVPSERPGKQTLPSPTFSLICHWAAATPKDIHVLLLSIQTQFIQRCYI